MAGNELSNLVTEGGTRRRDHIRLGAAAVGDDGVRLQVRRQRPHHGFHLAHRHA
jgi:hypothetical protein